MTEHSSPKLWDGDTTSQKIGRMVRHYPLLTGYIAIVVTIILIVLLANGN